MQKSIVCILAVGVAVMLTSCDPLTCSIEFIENETAQTLYLLRTDSITVDTLLAGDTLAFKRKCGQATFDSGIKPVHGFDYLSIRNASSICKKDIRIIENWNSVAGRKYDWEHHFVITNSDF